MVRFENMGDELFKSYMKGSMSSYAKDNVRAGHWEEAEAELKAKEQLQQILPQGQETEGHDFFKIINNENDQKLGVIWVAKTDIGGEQVSFLYDIVIDEKFRRQGYGKQALLMLERKAEDSGRSAVWLHVFAENKGAKRLYEQLGYKIMKTNQDEMSGETMSFHMAKQIAIRN